jgi:hypothetical protein
MPELQHSVRLPPPDEHEWSPVVREQLLSSWLRPGQAPPKPSTVGVTLSHYEKLFEHWDPFGAAIFNGELSARHREVLILRMAWLTKCRFQGAYYEVPAARAGLISGDIDAILEGSDSAALSSWDRVLVSVVDQLREHATIDDATWDVLAAHYTIEHLIEVPRGGRALLDDCLDGELLRHAGSGGLDRFQCVMTAIRHVGATSPTGPALKGEEADGLQRP